MVTIAAVTLEIALVVATVCLLHLLLLVFRNPHRPAWLRTGGAEPLAATVLVALTTLTMAALVAGLNAAGLNPFLAMGVSLAVAAVAWWVSWRAFAIGERLRRADEGRSPFGAPARTPSAGAQREAVN